MRNVKGIGDLDREGRGFEEMRGAGERGNVFRLPKSKEWEFFFFLKEQRICF